MLKKCINIITLSLLSILMSVYIHHSLLLIIVNFLVPIVICMAMKYNKKKSIIYKISMDIMIIILGLFIIWFIYNMFTVNLNSENLEVIISSINHIIINILLYLNILNLKINDETKYFYVNLVVTIMISLIYLNYYFNPMFIHNYSAYDDIVHYYSSIYITQNYSYFLIIEICLLIYYLLNINVKEKN